MPVYNPHPPGRDHPRSVAEVATGRDSPARSEDTDAGHHHQRHRGDQPPTSD